MEYASLEEAEEAFVRDVVTGLVCATRAWMTLYAIRESGLWRSKAPSFKEYASGLLDRMSEYFPASLSQMWSMLRICRRGMGLGLSARAMGFLLEHPSLANLVWSMAEWDRKKGVPVAFRSEEVKEEMARRYGSSEPREVLGALVEDLAALPSVGEARAVLEDVRATSSTRVSYRASFYQGEDGLWHVESLSVVVEHVVDGWVQRMDEYDILRGDGLPQEAVEELGRRLGISPWMMEEVLT
ncbi:MAG: hypothetical protein ACUVS5_11855 [Anaerolineae bacterium]